MTVWLITHKIYVSLNHFAAHLKLAQCCKSTVFQFKKFKTKKFWNKNWLLFLVFQVHSILFHKDNLVKYKRFSLCCAQSLPTLCSPIDCSWPGSSAHGIFQTRILEKVAISYSRVSFLTQGSNPCLRCLLHWQMDSLPLVPSGKLWIPVRHPTSYLCLIWQILLLAPLTLFSGS